MAAAIRADRRPLAGSERAHGGPEHRVRHLGVGGGRGHPRDHHAVVAVDDGAEIDLARRDAEFRHVGEPELVGCRGAEVPPDQILWCPGDLAPVGAVPEPPGGGSRHQALLAHYAGADLLRDDHAFASETCVYAAIAIDAAARPEEVVDARPGPGVPVRRPHRPHLVLVAAARHPERLQQVLQPMPRPQGFRQGRLLPVGRPVRVGARAFSQDLDRALEHVAPGLEPLDLTPQRPDEPPELVGIVRQVVSVSHRAGHLLAEQAVLPPVEDIPGDPIRLRHLGGRALPGHERHDGVGHPVGRDGTRQRGPAPGRCQLVHPVGKHLVAAGIPERTPGPGIAPPMREVVADRDAPLLLGVPAVAVGRQDPAVLDVLRMPRAQPGPRRVSQLVDHRCAAFVVSHVKLDRAPLLI